MIPVRRMKSGCNFFLSIVMLTGIIFLTQGCAPENRIDQLKRNVLETLSTQEGDFAIAFSDLSTGERLMINEKEVFHAASTMKTPVMIEIFKQGTLGILSLNDSIEVKNDFKSIVDSSRYSLSPDDDSEHELYNQLGSKKPIGDLVYDMIIMSSNLATNIVIEYADAKKVTQTMRDLGAPDIEILRGVEDTKAYERGLSNTTTAYDLLVIYEKLAKGEAVNPDMDKQMVDILLNQHFNEIIPAKLPDEVKVAHKTGSITGVQHDSGIVILPDGRKYVLVILSKNLRDVEHSIDAMANVSHQIYDFVAERSH
ncbi:MAG: serine hydrolase [Cyclobacteriaceae bacterium]